MSTRIRKRSSRQTVKTPRDVALGILVQVDTRKAFADLLLNQALKNGSMSSRDAAFATELVGGTLRWRARLDWILSQFVRNDLDKLTPWIRNGLRLGLYQMLFLDRVPAYAAVDEAVKLARIYGHAGTAGLTNAVLRKVLQELGSLPDPETLISDPAEALAVAYSHPLWLVERWRRRLGDDETRALLAANNESPSLCLRVNAMRTDRETLRRALAERGIEAEGGKLSRLSLTVRGNMVPSEIPEFQEGHFFVQDESETLVGELVAAEAGETVVDLCAAPGGKTCHIQESRGSRGTILAVDVQPKRLARVQENTARLGLSGVEPVCADGQELTLARPADRVLVDAPCSGLGVLRRRADARWRKTEASMRSLMPLEAGLLAAGATLLRPGGVLVYSVCSSEPEEGIRQVQAFLKAHPDFEIEDASGFISPEAVTDGVMILYPHRHGTDGAFAARLRKRA